MRTHTLSLLLCGVAYSAALTACQKTETSNSETGNTDLTSVSIIAASCTGCHQSENTAIPPIDTLTAEQLYTALLTYQADTDGETVMHRLMRGYTQDDIAQLSHYLGADTP